MGKAEENKKTKQNALYSTAFHLFTTKGLAKTTISDIVESAGVAKGTFYLYFKDKYDIRNKLIAHKTAELFNRAFQALQSQKKSMGFEESLDFLIDYILDLLSHDKPLLIFISKNLSWGVFRGALSEVTGEDTASLDFEQSYLGVLMLSEKQYRDPELLLFTILELVGATCHSCILYGQPVSIEEYKPVLHRSIHGILRSFETTD